MRSLIPQATYRFQFNKDFTFKDATRLVPYLSRLGVSHCYASPLLTARPGSSHGYDITDHKHLNPEIGTREDFDTFISVLREHGMHLMVDIVPNHMGIGHDNPWWVDVLENGPASAYARYFDIDWAPLKDELHGKVLIPILGGPYGQTLAKGELKLRFDEEQGRFFLNYYEHTYPINPLSYPMILEHRLEVLAARLGSTSDHYLEYESILTAFKHLPVHTEDDPGRMHERLREKNIACRRLTRLCKDYSQITEFIQENLQDFQPDGNDTTNQHRLHRLLEVQAYRLAYWRVAQDEINYRRFFDINDLAGLRIEDQRVFNDTHQLILELIGEGKIQGLRIDHPDGLFDPEQYFARLQEQARKALEEDGRELTDLSLGAAKLPFYLVVEKILAPFEKLPDGWAVHGTTGYEFANAVNGLFVDTRHEEAFTRIYHQFIGREMDYEELVYQGKLLIMKTSMTSELNVLSYHLNKISEADWSTRDFTLNSLRNALMEVVACFPVYRSYVTPAALDGALSREDRTYIQRAVALAKQRSTAIDTSIFDFIQRILLLDFDASADAAYRQAAVAFTMKFQQYTGPVMAKGLEDTTFYRYNRLASLNEVGGEPHQFGTSLSLFHYRNQERVRRAPHTLLNTSTHDTKRAEDVRARINVISEIPEEWHRHVYQWREMNQSKKTAVEDQLYPDRNDEYLFYQTLIGMWPLQPPGKEETATLMTRLEGYMLKAIREAKVHTSWINTNQAYEQAMTDFIRKALCREENAIFLNDFERFLGKIIRPGLLNALAQQTLKLTVPGVPDIYRGTETWDFSLVDPDNRRPVPFDELSARLEKFESVLSEDCLPETRSALHQELFAQIEDGRIKHYLSTVLLGFRKSHPELFRKGDYMPLQVTGPQGEHAVAFLRRTKTEALVVVVPRLIHTLMGEEHQLPIGESVWGDARLLLPASFQRVQWQNLLTCETLQAAGFDLRISDILNNFPLGVLYAKVLAV